LQSIVNHGLIPEDHVEGVRERVEENPETLDTDQDTIVELINEGILNYEQIRDLLATDFSMEVVSLPEMDLPPELIETLKVRDESSGQSLAERYSAFPVYMDGSDLYVALCDPMNMEATDDLGQFVGMEIYPYLVAADELESFLDRHYKDGSHMTPDGSEGQGLSGLEESSLELGSAELNLDNLGDEDAGPIVKYVQTLISDAVNIGSSDIHLEPLEKRFRIRLRVDGVLQEVDNPPKRLQPAIVSRLKIQSGISIAEKRIPQDGRIQTSVGGKPIDLRVSTVPTNFGESIVMRILDKESLSIGLPQLGFFSDDQALFERMINMPDGIFLVTGPTGSGKSTTLYSALNVINKPDRKIITVEDPVEYQLKGINQVQVQREVGMTFSAALRSMLRQAPNIIMVGEIRDGETAEIAVNASLTGHMVFSTLHTNDAPSAVSRLVDIGLKPYLVSASLRGALAQRLVRRICDNCKEAHDPDPRTLNSLGIQRDQAAEAVFMKGRGCPKCRNTGFKGRMGIFEIFTIDEEIEQMIYENRTIVELRKKAQDLGMRTLREDGIRKVLAGRTTAEEVLKATVSGH
ncbi:MAG: GspE/PulE family protein, partial [Opitutae bacterium]